MVTRSPAPNRIRLRALTGATILALVTGGCASFGAVAPGADGEVVIEMGDYAFDPGTVRVTAGQTVTFVLSNIGAHTHEFMIGRDPVIYDDYLNNPFADAFEVDFFEGLEVFFDGAGMPMNFAGMPEMDMENMGDMDMSGTESPSEMDMSGTESPSEMDMDGMEGDHAEESSTGGGNVVVEPGEEGDDHADEEGEEGEEGHGGMVMLDRDEGGRLTVTIPQDRVGTWTIGCFQEEGGHFVDGMQATLIVEEA